MTANLEFLSSSVSSASVRSERQIAETRQRGWLLELERALLDLGAKPIVATHEDRYSADIESDVNETGPIAPTMIKEGGQIMVPHADQGTYLADAPPPETRLEQTSDAMIEHASGQKPTHQIASGGGIGKSTDGEIAEQALAHTDAATWMAMRPVFASYQPLQVSGVVETDTTLQTVSVAKPGFRMLSGVLTRLQVSNDLQGERDLPETNENMTESEVGTPNTADLVQEGETYGRRQLHLYRGDDGIHAWLRDADVTEARANAIAAALRRELSESGARLAGLTFNGKKVAGIIQGHHRDYLDELVLADGALQPLDTVTFSAKFKQETIIKGVT